SDSYKTWAMREAISAAKGAPERAKADLALSDVHYATGRFTGIWPLLGPALSVALELADPDLLALFYLSITSRFPPSHLEEPKGLAAIYWDFLQRTPPVSTSTGTKMAIGVVIASLVNGNRQRSEEAIKHLDSLADRTRDPYPRLVSLLWSGTL